MGGISIHLTPNLQIELDVVDEKDQADTEINVELTEKLVESEVREDAIATTL